jgi:hypothetical protein
MKALETLAIYVTLFLVLGSEPKLSWFPHKFKGPRRRSLGEDCF